MRNLTLLRAGICAGIACTTFAQTNFTGDVLQGAQVISYLDLNDVPSSAVTRYYLRVGELNGGYPLHIPVIVARGPPETLKTGKKLSLSGTVHGDELNPVRVIQKTFEYLEENVSSLNGTGVYPISDLATWRLISLISIVIGVPTVNPMGVYLNQRNFFTSSSSGFLTNINRVFPGVNSSSGGNGGNLLAYNLWNHVWGNTSQVDVAIDLRKF